MLATAQTTDLPRDAAIALGGALVIAASAYLRVPMWPVPMTMQTFAVLLVGGMAGARVGAAAAMLTVLAGIAGLPVLAAGTIGGPTTGYLLGFIPAAFAAGWLLRDGARGWRVVASLLAADAILFACGLVWLHGFLPDWQATLAAGLLPFLVGDAVKVALASALVLLRRAD